MWSDNRYIDITINVLLFIVSIHFLHYGQILLPIICLILFINNGFRFKVNNLKTFILLSLFALSFLGFSYQNSLYCVMGMFCPMAYYIGSNLKDRSPKSIKTIIYIFTIGMATHVLLNAMSDYIRLGSAFLTSYSHHDIWTGESISATATGVNYTMIIGCIFYIIFYEKNKVYKYSIISLFILMMAYNFILGRRTPVLMLVISLGIFVFGELFVFRSKSINPKIIKAGLIISVLILVLFILAFGFDAFGLIGNVTHIRLIDKFLWQGLDGKRIELFIKALKLAPYHLWGGQQISSILQIQVHDLWMDTFDFAGIITLILLIIYTVIVIKNIYGVIVNKKISKDFRLLIFNLFICILMQMLLEPVMTGSPIFLLCTIILATTLERVKTNE